MAKPGRLAACVVFVMLVHELSCDSDIPPGKARLFAVHGVIDHAGEYVNTATATATSDGLPLRPVSAEASLKVA